MINDHIVTLPRELADELISALLDTDNYWHLAEHIELYISEKKHITALNSVTEAQCPIFRHILLCEIPKVLPEKFYSKGRRDSTYFGGELEIGAWVKTFWETGTFYYDNEATIADPCISSVLGETDTGPFYLYLQADYHEILINLETEEIKVRVDCSATSPEDPELTKWTVWENQDDFVGSSIDGLKKTLEERF